MKSSADSAAKKAKSGTKGMGCGGQRRLCDCQLGRHCCLCCHRSICVATLEQAPSLIAAGAIAGAIASVASKFAGDTLPADLQQQVSILNPMRSFRRWSQRCLGNGHGTCGAVLGGGLRLTLSSFGGALFDQLGHCLPWRKRLGRIYSPGHR